MRTILALSLISAAFVGLVPAASADCIQNVCYVADGYDYGSCDQGATGQSVGTWSYNPDVAYYSVGGGSSCSNYGWYSSTGVYAGAGVCDASFNCYSAGAVWSDYTYFGVYRCDSLVYASVDGQYIPQPLALCAVAGGPPQIPVILP